MLNSLLTTPTASGASCNLRIVRGIQEETPPPDTPSCSLIPEHELTPQPTFEEVVAERGGVEEVDSDQGTGTKFPRDPTPDASPDQDGSSGDPSVEEFPAVCVCVRVRTCVCVCVCTCLPLSLSCCR